MIQTTILFDLSLGSNLEASLDGKKWFPAKYVGQSLNTKAPYICRRTDLKSEKMREYSHIRSENMTTTINGKKYRLVEVTDRLPIDIS